MKNEADFWPADKRQMFSQIDTIILGVCSEAHPSYPKQQNNNSSQCLCNISKKKLEMKLIFCM